MITFNKSIGIAKRKTSVAKVIINKGIGKIKINNLSFEKYFSLDIYQKNYMLESILLLNLKKKLDIVILVKGGGKNSQLDAIKLAISKAICVDNNNYRTTLSKLKLLSTDERIKERRKYGLKKARKAPQYHKR